MSKLEEFNSEFSKIDLAKIGGEWMRGRFYNNSYAVKNSPEYVFNYFNVTFVYYDTHYGKSDQLTPEQQAIYSYPVRLSSEICTLGEPVLTDAVRGITKIKIEGKEEAGYNNYFYLHYGRINLGLLGYHDINSIGRPNKPVTLISNDEDGVISLLGNTLDKLVKVSEADGIITWDCTVNENNYCAYFAPLYKNSEGVVTAEHVSNFKMYTAKAEFHRGTYRKYNGIVKVSV